MNSITLTYEELADRLGISVKSCKNHVRRKGWGRTIGNDGKARVVVPSEALPEAPSAVLSEAPPAAPSAAPSDGPSENPVHALVARVAVLEAELAGERQLVTAERRRGDEAVERLAQVEQERKDLQADRDRWMQQAVRPWWRRLARS